MNNQSMAEQYLIEQTNNSINAFDEVMNNVVNSEHNEIDNLALSLSGKKELSVGVKGINKEDRLFGTNNPYSKY